MEDRRWQDLANAILGGWLVASPWTLDYAGTAPLMTRDALMAGTAILVLAAAAIYIPRAWQEAGNGVAGLWLLASPWLLGFSGEMPASGSIALVGALVAALAIWALFEDDEVVQWWNDRNRAL